MISDQDCGVCTKRERELAMFQNVSSLDFEKLRTEFNITDEAIQSSEFSKDDLSTIYLDYKQRYSDLLALKTKFLEKYIVAADNLHIHSYNGRVKDPYHLIEKIVRKRHTHDKKYADMTVADYYKYITDLIGCRILLVYKESWKEVHDYLVSVFPNNPINYIDDERYAASYDGISADIKSPFMAECPVVYTREGDNEDIYIKAKDVIIKRPGYYRSVHYIVRYGEYYIEIQVRTLFEEAWGEVDHERLYPLYKDNQNLVDFSAILNRTAGLGDELSTYFKNRVGRPTPSGGGPLLDVPIRYGATSPLPSLEDYSCNASSEPIDLGVPEVHAEQATPKTALDMLIYDNPNNDKEE